MSGPTSLQNTSRDRDLRMSLHVLPFNVSTYWYVQHYAGQLRHCYGTFQDVHRTCQGLVVRTVGGTSWFELGRKCQVHVTSFMHNIDK